MSNAQPNPVSVDQIEKLVAAIDAAVGDAVAVASRNTNGGRGIDDSEASASAAVFGLSDPSCHVRFVPRGMVRKVAKSRRCVRAP